jgi:hypothetical protein
MKKLKYSKCIHFVPDCQNTSFVWNASKTLCGLKYSQINEFTSIISEVNCKSCLEVLKKLDLETSKQKILSKYGDPKNFEKVFRISKFFFSKIIFTDGSFLIVVMSSTQREYFFKSKLCTHAVAIGGLGYAKPIV